MNQSKRIAAYCRVSTDRQKEEGTISNQKRLIKEWADENNEKIVDWYCDDGWSGDVLERPELDRLLDDVDTGKWSSLVFLDRDRVARNVAYQEYIFRELRDKNIELICVNYPMGKTDDENALQQVLAVFAELDRKRTIRKLYLGKINKAKKGLIVHGPGSYGYRYVSKTSTSEGYLKIVEDEAEIVRTIYHWVTDKGYSIRRVIKELYIRKIPSPKGNDHWVKSSVERLLKNETYIGKSYSNRRKAVVPRNPQTSGGYKKIKKSLLSFN